MELPAELECVPNPRPFHQLRFHPTNPGEGQNIVLFITSTIDDVQETFMFIGKYIRKNHTLVPLDDKTLYLFRLYKDQSEEPDLLDGPRHLSNQIIKKHGKVGEIIPYIKTFCIDIHGIETTYSWLKCQWASFNV